jgi:hypothetical protein
VDRRSFLLLSAATFLFLASPDFAARLPISTITVNILSVGRESFERHDIRVESVELGEQSRQFYMETTIFVVKAQIETIGFDDNHHLNPGKIIDIRYEVRRTPDIRGEPMVKVGETWTVHVFGSGTRFEGRNWQRPQ